MILLAALSANGAYAAKSNRETAAEPAVSSQVSRSTLLRIDFNTPPPAGKPNMTTVTTAVSGPVVARAVLGDVGTIDVAGGLQKTGGLRLAVEGVLGAKNGWEAKFSTVPLAVVSHEENADKLTLAFSLSASAAKTVLVQIDSLDSRKRRTGGLETRIIPAAADFYQRFALDLGAMKPFGGGKFHSTDPFIRISIVLNGTNWASVEKPSVLLDNLHYASPAFYVDPKGSDRNDGQTEKTALASPQEAVDRSHPGDIILLMGGTYTRRDPQAESIVQFTHAGAPDAWISLKNYPGQKPVLATDYWNAINMTQGTRTTLSQEPALAYLEVRGLTIRGEADIAKTKYAALIGSDDGRVNGIGIRVEGRFAAHAPHHLRFADNTVTLCNATGMFVYNVDWVSIENNEISNNCWNTVYEGSGLCLFGGKDFNPSDGYKVLVTGNRVFGNRCFLKSRYAKKVFNGNGIQIDANFEHPDKPETLYQGRTLVSRNLAFNNGGVGIQMWGSHRLDIIGNTAYYNGASPELRWGQIASTICDDIRYIDNIMVAQPDRTLNTWYGTSENRVTHVVRTNNVYFGGRTPPVPGDRDRIVDPQFINPSLDAAVADFRLKPGSPAFGAGWSN